MNDIDPRMASKLEKLYDDIDAQAPPSRLLSFQPDEHGRRRGIELAAGAVGILVVAAAGVGLAIGLSNHHGKPVGVAAPSSPTPTVVRAGPADLAPQSGIGVTPGLAGCGGDYANGFIIRSFAGSVVPAQSTPGGGWACYTVNKQDVVIAGIQGTRTAKLQLNTPNCFDLATLVEYDFTSGGRVYAIVFQRNAGAGPDLTSTLDTMMTFSWAFHA
jgi:hypothetical protein